MANKYQIAFLASLFGTFFSLVFLSRYLNSKLVAAGYDISRLILIGLPVDPSFETAPLTMGFDLQSLGISGLENLEVAEVITSPAFIVSATVCVAGAIYTTFLRQVRTKPLDPENWKEFSLQKKIQISPNTAIYRFSLPYKDDVLGLPTGQHISISADINGKQVTRSYTPISDRGDCGHFDLLIKTYEKGNISRHVASLKVGGKVRVKGPKGQFKYTPGIVDHISMIAGGTGITPMYQVINAILKNPQDKTTISLIYANVNPEDILLKDELRQLSERHPKQFKAYYVLNNPPASWNGGVGFVNKDHIKEYHPNPAHTNSKLLICGPPPMVAAMKKHLEELAYPAPRTISKFEDKVFVF